LADRFGAPGVAVFFAIVFLFLNTSPINAVVLQSVPGDPPPDPMGRGRR